jgi:hypothetical protein
MSIDHHALIAELADIMSRNNWDALSNVFTDDAVLAFPQSGEVFRGIRNIRAQYEQYPGGLKEGRIAASSVAPEEPTYLLTPRYLIVSVEGTGNRGAATFRTQYPDGSRWWVVQLYEIVGARIAHSRAFFAAEFEAPEWRAPFRESSGTAPWTT